MPLPAMPSTQHSNPPHSARHLPFPVVGIGLSAGGLQALIAFLQQMPADNGMAFVAIMHLSPDHESHAQDILQAVTPMPVLQVSEATRIEANHVYVISPAQHLHMEDGYLRVSHAEKTHGSRLAIDLFFRTLADVHAERAVGIVLSGTGTDGSVGLARIKELGGITLVQAPEDAEHDGMPRSAILTGLADIVLPAAAMPAKLVEIWANASHINLPPAGDADAPDATPGLPQDDAARAETALRDIISQLKARSGHDFKHYKRATVLRRIERRLQVNSLPDLPSYRDYLRQQPEEIPALLKDMLIGVTNFFRDSDAFAALENEVLPRLLDNMPSENDEIRVWSAGCATGEEAYTLAMLLCDQASRTGSMAKLQVFATDIDERAISIGRAAFYPESIETDVSLLRLRQYFNKEQLQYHIKKEVREKVLFAAHNLLRDPPFSRLHLISCRNLLIYLDREVQAEILRVFHFALRAGGYLFLGSSESADVCSDLFTAVDKKNRIYQAKLTPASQSRAPTLPVSGFQRPASTLAERVQERRKIPFAEVHQRVLEQYAPPSVIVNHDSEIVHMSARAGTFLHHAAGEPSHNLLTLIQPELRLELRTALYQAVQTGKSVEACRVQLRREGRAFYVTMVARPFEDPVAGAGFVLVLFDEVEDSISGEPGLLGDTRKDSVLSQLESELQYTKEQLQGTVEQSEISTEELKASNEELQAINEELRSATEELETSKEELQSINEELITVNNELKARVEETSKINDDLQNLIASTDIATVFVDRTMRIKWFTPRARDIFNIITTDAGRSLLDITHRLDYATLATDAMQVFESLRQIEREVSSADHRWYIARLLPYRTADDRIEGAVLTFIDITDRHQADARWRAGEARMARVAESMRDYAIITMDEAGCIVSWNKGAERIFGYKESEAIGQLGNLIYAAADSAQLSLYLLAAQQNGGYEDEAWLQNKTGERLFCSNVMSPLPDLDPPGYALVCRDLSSRLQQEEIHKSALEQEHSELLLTRASNQRKDEFLAVMSHELKHPLNLIQLNAEMLGRMSSIKASPPALRAAELILRSVSSQARIIDDLLDLSRVRTGKLKLNRAPVDLASVLSGIIDVFTPDAAEHGLSVQLISTNTPLIIDADAVRLEQIVWNLLSNSLKFTPAGGKVSVRLGVEAGMARLDVKDTGNGIDPAFLPKVFDMFGQAEAHTARQKTGLGIGLALVQQLVDAQGGQVEATSAGVGQGACFTIWLPTHGIAPLPADPAINPDAGQLQGVQVLLLDDSAEVLECLAALLESEGAAVSAHPGGAPALKDAQAHAFDVVVSDIGMPGMDGYEFIRQLRQLPQHTRTPAIALTGYGSDADATRATSVGFNTHLGKPVSFDLLVETLVNLTRKP